MFYKPAIQDIPAHFSYDGLKSFQFQMKYGTGVPVDLTDSLVEVTLLHSLDVVKWVFSSDGVGDNKLTILPDGTIEFPTINEWDLIPNKYTYEMKVTDSTGFERTYFVGSWTIDKNVKYNGALLDKLQGVVLYPEKGDAFTYEDFTPEQIAELQLPATEATAGAIAATEGAIEATGQALEGANLANEAAENANGKIAIIDGDFNRITADVSKISNTIVFDDFDTVDQVLNGRVSPSGHVWNVSGPGANVASIKDRTLVSNGLNFYASLQNGQPIKYLSGVFSFKTSVGDDVTGSPQAVLIAQQSSLNLGNMLHCEFQYNGWSLKKRLTATGETNSPFISIGTGRYSLLADGTQYHCGMRIIKGSGAIDTVIIESPDGTETVIEYTDIPTDTLTAATWQVQVTQPNSAVIPSWHHVAIGEKRVYNTSVKNYGVSPSDLGRVAGYGYGRRNSKRFVIKSDGWYRFASHTAIQGYTIQGRVTLTTTGVQPSHFQADIIGRNDRTPIITTLLNYGGYHLSEVRVGSNSDSVYIDVYIGNTGGTSSVIELNIDVEGYMNLLPVLILNPTVPTLTANVTVVTQPITTFKGTYNTTGWARLATQTSGPSGFIMYGIIRVKAWDSGRSIVCDLLVSATPTVINPIQILNNSGGIAPITKVRLSRETNKTALDIYCAFAGTNPLTVEASYIGWFGVISSLVDAGPLATESAEYDVYRNQQVFNRTITGVDTNLTIKQPVITSGSTYVMGNTETHVYINTSLLTTATVTLPETPVNGQIATIQSANGIKDLTVNPGTGKTLNGGNSYILRNKQRISFRYWATTLTWYLNEAPEYNPSIYLASGNGSSTSIIIPHGVAGGVTANSSRIVSANNAASAGILYTTVDATNITIVHSTAPASGTNNLSYSILIRP